MDNVSEISLYSHPTSRGATPSDGPTAQTNANPAFMGPRNMPNSKGGLVRMRSTSSRSTASRYEDEILKSFPNPPEFRSPQDCGPEPYEEYFSIPVSKDRLGQDDARRRRSAKELIKRFESISADNSPVTLPGNGTRITPGRIHRGDPGLFTPPTKVEKKTSPLRQSFRNLLSVFKKGKRLGKANIVSSDAPSESEPPVERLSSDPLKRENEPDPFTFGGGPSSRICASPTYSLHGGLLLYLSPPAPASSILPVWITCDAVLHGSHILLTSSTTQGIQSTIVVSLRACTDIKSLAPDEIVAEHKALLPAMEDSTDPKVFELFFDGKESQRFAAPTVKDRASWVSAIWDAVLHRQERLQERTKAEIKKSLRIDVGVVSFQPAPATTPLSNLINEQVLTPPDTPFSDSRISRDHELPPLPQDSSSTHSVSSAAPPTFTGNHSQLRRGNVLVVSVDPRSQFNARKDSELASPINDPPSLEPSSRSFDARSHSPSLVNLGRRSVVRKRLVEMQSDSTSTRSGSTSRDSRFPRRAVATPLTRGPVEKPTSPASSRAPSTLNVPDSRLTSPVSAASDSSTLSVSVRPKSAFRLRDEMRGRDSTVAHTHGASGGPSPASETAMVHPPSEPPTTPVGSQSEGTIDALLDIMDVHAERQLIKTGELDYRLEDVQNGVRDVAANLRVAISGREKDSRNIAELRSAIDDVRSALATLSTKNVPEQEEIQTVAKNRAPGEIVDGETKSGLMGSELSEFLRANHGTGIEQADISDIQRKLDVLLELSTLQKNVAPSAASEALRLDAAQASESESQVANGASDLPDETIVRDAGPGEWTDNTQKQNILHDEGKSTQLMEQQAESVRYLNELNAWLEAFVNGSTAQIGGMAEDVQKLCKALGGVDELQDGLDDNSDPTAATMTVLQSVQKLIADNQRRDRDSAHLLTTMNGLAAALNEDMRKNAEMRNAYTTESVLGVIERQRRDQERMLRALANELSDDIRGERLRFVEAMKEATAINVQIHVEEFKKELTREVLISTQEVGRLQRERQLLEQQIADLFAFYSKQKQTALVSNLMIE
ncbi:hypothetical protein EDB87DRAFT_1209118 [Lactarius vividus]|nr:hypothetical protein EDB87DRAFT_115845 [Lactarius vividus]KAH9056548.1 hypothetical protein EDB87DRAFT_1209118 [Lactarius vividus]